MTWTHDGYWRKAKVYAEKAMEYGQGRWENPFWYTLTLEHLARAALTKVHPVLNADPQSEGAHILFALGFEIKSQPKTIPIHSVFARLEQIINDFKKPHRTFCDYFSHLRNQELHSGEIPFESLGTGKWQARFFETCEILCKSFDKSLKDLFGTEIADLAKTMIASARTKKKGKVTNLVAEHRKEFKKKPKHERSKLLEESNMRNAHLPGGYKGAKCPACKALGRLAGDFIRESEAEYRDEHIFVEHLFLASSFACSSCGLTLSDIEEIQIVELDPTFTSIEETTLHEIYQPEYEQEYDNM